MTYIYLHIFENNESNPSFHEEQLLAIAHVAALVGCFSRTDRHFTSEKFYAKKKTKQNKTTITTLKTI